MIQATGLTKFYGTRAAVNGITFAIPPGKVTGFLGPNGAGKSTTMRMVLGLDRPTAGKVTVNGVRYDQLAAPLREVGALLDAKAIHGGRTAYNHLSVLAKANAIPKRRVDEMVDLVGLGAVAKKRSKGFSLGMGQRLGIAAALLGDPQVVMFDEPVNGLDPEGILWIRNLMKALAAEGRTVFVSSHLMSEMALTADHLLVIGRGQILADQSMQEFISQNSVSYVRIRSPYMSDLGPRLAARGWQVEQQADHSVHVHGANAAQVGDVAGDANLRLHELTLVQSSLEEAFMRLTADSVEYHAGTNLTGAYPSSGGGVGAAGPVPPGSVGPGRGAGPVTTGPGAGPISGPASGPTAGPISGPTAPITTPTDSPTGVPADAPFNTTATPPVPLPLPPPSEWELPSNPADPWSLPATAPAPWDQPADGRPTDATKSTPGADS